MHLWWLVFLAQLTPVGSIQGTGATSPRAGQQVTTSGIVIARKSNGFFLQAPQPDADPRTSDGLFVFTQTAPPDSAAIANLVTVTGTVAEFRPNADPFSPTLTQLTQPSITVTGRNQPLPEPVLLTRRHLQPAGGLEQLEHLEGMRVRLEAARAVGPGNSSGIFYAVFPGTPRPFREPGIEAPDPLPSPASPRWDGNPEKLRIDVRGGSNVATGALLGPVTGTLDYAFRAYTILAEGSPPIQNTRRAQPIPAPAPGEITIASFNLERITEERLPKAALSIRTMLRLPDVVGVQEADNVALLQRLADQINRDALAAGQPDPQYRAYLEEGNDPGGIDVGFLVKTARIRADRVTQIGKAEDFNDRPPLVLEASLGSFRFTVVVNHLRSLINVNTAPVQTKRRAQAEFLARLLQQRQAENVAVIGDFNAFEFDDGYVDVMSSIERTPEPDFILLTRRLKPEQRYSYVFDGDAQTIDHVLLNQHMRRFWTRVVYARVNTDFPPAWRADNGRPERVSDHDPVVAYFAPQPPPVRAAAVTSAATFLTGAIAPGEIVSIFAPGAQVRFDEISALVLYADGGQINALVPDTLADRENTELRVDNYDPVTLPVAPAAPGVFWIGEGAMTSVYATGLGPPDLPLSVFVDGYEAELLGVERWPGLADLYIRIPDEAKTRDVVVVAGERHSPEAAFRGGPAWAR